MPGPAEELAARPRRPDQVALVGIPTIRTHLPAGRRRTHDGLRAARAIPAALLVVAGLTGCSPIRWEVSYERALQVAAERRTRVLVAFHSVVNADCRAMDAEVFSDANVQKHVRQYVPVRLDPLIHRQLAKQFGVETVPAFLVVRPDGAVVGGRGGRMDAEQFGYFLIRSRFN
ncbi:MAG: thioredoxin family protein [Phycisphaerae bacterium]|nr:thioredoxin family protein [Phycisphaerae bacterium]